MNLGQRRRELTVQLMGARTVSEAQEIARQLRDVGQAIQNRKAAILRENDPTGRLTDLAYLRREFDRAPNAKIRTKIANAAATIRNEPESVRRLRKEMIAAQRSGNRLRAREIGEFMYESGR